jgi:hypothetical protein
MYENQQVTVFDGFRVVHLTTTIEVIRPGEGWVEYPLTGKKLWATFHDNVNEWWARTT